MDTPPTYPYALPATFEQDTIFLEPVTTSGHRLHFYTDTGGGTWIYAAAAAEVGMSGTAPSGEWATASLPAFDRSAWVPAPAADGLIQLNPSGQLRELLPPVGRSGMLGQQWFGGRIWEIDYRQQTMVLHRTPPDSTPDAIVPLGFPESEGRRGSNFPRIEVVVDDEPLDMLLDTGAHTRLTPDATETIGAGTDVATSFIINSIADRWRARHPGWRTVSASEAATGAGMIEVPNIRVGTLDTGPVWFTRRADHNFTEYMSQWMDRTVVGGLGGNALRAFRLVLDYPGAQATLRAQL
ncbi:MAG TPA: hypothetical protein VHC49_11310 [Mycobacteriales bacterium]|nr:hypothetical protein [Mycobacteriales bacterium]